MRHLGTLRGSGMLKCGCDPVGRADYEFDGYVVRPGEVAGSGEVRMSPPLLAESFGRKDLCLHTDDGRLLSIRFSGKGLAATATVAHADVFAGLPDANKWRR